MEINGRKIGPDHPPYMIAEMSNNHFKDPDRAGEIIRAARAAGADAVKIQTYEAGSLTIDCVEPDFVIQSPLWKGRTYFRLYREIALPVRYTADLFRCAREAGITLFSSPFDQAAIDLLMDQACPAFKIASFEAIDPEFLKRVARTQKPVLMSTGISTIEEIRSAVDILRDNGTKEILLFHCISEYPARPASFNLKALDKLRQFTPYVGLSDHSLDDTAALAAVARGACAVEKHFTLPGEDSGPDAAFSITPEGFEKLKSGCVRTWECLGSEGVLDTDTRPGREHARSLYIVRDVNEGETAGPDNIRSIRPGYGLHPQHYRKVLGKRFNADYYAGTALKWEYVS